MSIPRRGLVILTAAIVVASSGALLRAAQQPPGPPPPKPITGCGPKADCPGDPSSKSTAGRIERTGCLALDSAKWLLKGKTSNGAAAVYNLAPVQGLDLRALLGHEIWVRGQDVTTTATGAAPQRRMRVNEVKSVKDACTTP
jgi:hypothetical protein